MDYKYLNSIDSPADLKRLDVSHLADVCAELRDFILQELSHNPGHLASSLGTVELIVALHYVFDSPQDKIVFDVGHQAYVHKILTGRRERFHTNRQFKGIAPFPTPLESVYDAFIGGHASNSISAALGMNVAHALLHSSAHTVAVIGDGAMTGGLAFEGLNNVSMDKNNLLIVLNDNNMAIDPIKGGFTQYLLNLTTRRKYNKLRWYAYRFFSSLGFISERRKKIILRQHNALKASLTGQSNNIFQGLDIRYFGPADGHDVVELVRIFREIKGYKGPKVLHIITQKGKGYAPAEQSQTVWHAPGEFNVQTGERNGDKALLWQDVFGQALVELMREDDRVVGISPAMLSGCSMDRAKKVFPERVFDVGIAEGHAITFSAGMAKEGLIPYCNIYSSFLQRSFDNLIHDVAILNLHVVICVDRAGIVGNDGATHHGLFDMAYLRSIPNMQIFAPRTASDLRNALQLAKTMKGVVAIRYPRGRVGEESAPPIEYGKGVQLTHGTQLAIISIGAIGNTVQCALQDFDAGIIAHYDMRWLKPLDTDILDAVGQNFGRVLVVEEGTVVGGMGSAVLEYFAKKNYTPRVWQLGVEDCFVEHGSTAELLQMLQLDKEGIATKIKQILNS